MSDENERVKPIQFIRELCKRKNEEELFEAEENFREYLMVIKEICERIEREDKGESDFDDL